MLKKINIVIQMLAHRIKYTRKRKNGFLLKTNQNKQTKIIKVKGKQWEKMVVNGRKSWSYKKWTSRNI